MKSARSVTDQLPDISGLPSATKSSTQCRVYLNLAMEFSLKKNHCFFLFPQPEYFALMQHFSTFFLLN